MSCIYFVTAYRRCPIQDIIRINSPGRTSIQNVLAIWYNHIICNRPITVTCCCATECNCSVQIRNKCNTALCAAGRAVQFQQILTALGHLCPGKSRNGTHITGRRITTSRLHRFNMGHAMHGHAAVVVKLHHVARYGIILRFGGELFKSRDAGSVGRSLRPVRSSVCSFRCRFRSIRRPDHPVQFSVNIDNQLLYIGQRRFCLTAGCIRNGIVNAYMVCAALPHKSLAIIPETGKLESGNTDSSRGRAFRDPLRFNGLFVHLCSKAVFIRRARCVFHGNAPRKGRKIHSAIITINRHAYRIRAAIALDQRNRRTLAAGLACLQYIQCHFYPSLKIASDNIIAKKGGLMSAPLRVLVIEPSVGHVLVIRAVFATQGHVSI